MMAGLGTVFKRLVKKRVGRLDRRWAFNANSELTSAPVVADIDRDGKNEIIFGAKDGKVFLLNSDATLRWFFDSNEKLSDVERMFLDTESVNSISSSPTVADVTGDGKLEIAFGTEQGKVFLLGADGKAIWKHACDGAIRGKILLYDLLSDKDTNVIFGCGDGKLYVLNSAGKEVWYFDAESPIQSAPAVIPKEKPIIVFGADNGTVYGVDSKGDLAWKFKTEDRILAQPTIAKLFSDNRYCIIIGSSDNRLYVLDEAGELLWKYQSAGAIISRAVIADINKDGKSEIVFGSCDNKVYALTKEGDRLWSYETDFWVTSEAIIEDVDGDGNVEIIAGSFDHNIYVLQAEGDYVLDYVPGLSGVVQQSGHYAEIMTKEAGKITGKKLWQFRTDGLVMGCAFLPEEKAIIVSSKHGKIDKIVYLPE